MQSKISFNKHTTYAVLDLEVSKPFDSGGKIIQIGISFIENWQIKETFSTLVNPGQKISKEITELTGITNRKVSKAPFFEEIAFSIKSMLSGHVFVAHNVGFDLPFLNGELKRAGIDPLDVNAIDTVQLSQILLPTLNGYKLPEIIDSLKLSKYKPHRADDDAKMTAQLLIHLKKVGDSLPKETVDLLLSLPLELLKQTQSFFTIFSPKMGSQKIYSKYDNFLILSISENVFQESDSPYTFEIGKNLSKNSKFPIKMEKSGIYSFFDNSSNDVKVIFGDKESAQDSAIFTSLIKATNETPVLVNIEKKEQEEEIVQKINYFSDQVLKRRVSIGRLSSWRDYIDLRKFSESLKITDNKPLQFLKARILVWLTKTEKGLLSEIQRGFSEEQQEYFSSKNVANPNYLKNVNYFYHHLDSISNDSIIISTQENLISLRLFLKELASEKEKKMILLVMDADAFFHSENVTKLNYFQYKQRVDKGIFDNFSKILFIESPINEFGKTKYKQIVSVQKKLALSNK